MSLKLLICLVLVVWSTSADDTLDQQQQIDPIYQTDDSDQQYKEQEKRLINPNINNYGWAKHIGYNPRGKYLIGYTPVDLKYVPIIRPVHFKPRARPRYPWRPRPQIPTPPMQQAWIPMENKPVYGPPKPVVNLPPTPVVNIPAVYPVKPPDVVVPAPPPPPSPAPPSYVPQLLPPTQLLPIPNNLFQVTKPNLPVLPLGAQFPSPVLNYPPVKSFVPPSPVVRPLVPAPEVSFHGKYFPQFFGQQIPQQIPIQVPLQVPQRVPVQVPQQIPLHVPQQQIPLQVPQQQIPQQIPLQVPQSQIPLQVPQSQIPLQVPQQQIPQQLPALQPFPRVPFFPFRGINLNTPLPSSGASYPQTGIQQLQPPNVPSEQHDVQVPQHQVLQQQQQQSQYLPPPQPFENFLQKQRELLQQQQQFEDQQQLLQQQQQQQQQQEYQQNQNQGIQPGQTDLQLPYHLPTHPHISNTGFQPSTNVESFQMTDAVLNQVEVFRPSISLEPPYTQRREDNVSNEKSQGLSNHKTEVE